jgi:hypothetical protein
MCARALIGECWSESRQLPVGFQSTKPGLCLPSCWRRPTAVPARHCIFSIGFRLAGVGLQRHMHECVVLLPAAALVQASERRSSGGNRSRLAKKICRTVDPVLRRCSTGDPDLTVRDNRQRKEMAILPRLTADLGAATERPLGHRCLQQR